MAERGVRQAIDDAAHELRGSGGLVRTFIRHPNAANLLMMLMILLGVFAILKINTQFFPSVDRPAINVSVSWSGASAEDIEANLLAVIEPEVRFVDGVDVMTSTAREGSGSIRLEFEDGSDMQRALSEVETAVKGISTLPQDAETPTVSKATFFDRVASLSVGGTAPEAIKREWAKNIRDELIARGIDKVDFTALRDREIRVDIPERELRRLGLTINDVSSAVTDNSRDLPSGTLEGAVERQLRSLADAETPKTLGNIEVVSFASGEKVRLGDIATISDAFDTNETRGFAGGDVAIEIDVRRSASADTLRTARILDEYLEELIPQLPHNIEINTYEVAADSLLERIMLLVKNGLGGLILVVAILFLFLDGRIAFWVAAGIPVALLATVGFMFASGQTINMISLFGLIMMLGIIVDDAIVVGEHTYTRLEMGDDPMMAAENGVSMMIRPVMAAMTTTLAAFAPMLLISDTIGQIIGVLPLVVMAVIVASLLECFYVLPGHLAHALERQSGLRWSYWRQFFFAFVIVVAVATVATPYSPLHGFVPDGSTARSWLDGLSGLPMLIQALLIGGAALLLATALEFVILGIRRRSGSAKRAAEGAQVKAGGFRGWFDGNFARFRDGPFNRFVALSYNWRYVTISIAVGFVLMFAVGLIQGKRVEFVFFPSPEAENIRGNVSFIAGLPEEDALRAVARVEEAFRDVEQELTGGGEPLAESIFIMFSKASRFGGTSATIKVQLTSSETRTVRTPDIVRAWRNAVPDLAGVSRFSIFQSRGGPPGRDIDIELRGDRIADLKAAATEMIPILGSIAGVSGADDNLPYGKPELVVEMKPRGAALGFTAENIGRQLRNAFDGQIPFRFARGDDEVTVRVSQLMRIGGTGALRNFELKSPAGEFVPLTEVATLDERQGFAYISRKDGKTKISVTGDIDNEVNTTDGVIEELEASGIIAAIAGRYGIDYQYGGRSQEQETAFADLRLGMIVALSVIYIILAWVFGSYWRPFAVMLIIPFGIVGAVFGHWVMGIQLTILSWIGLLGLSGILVNDSIILVTRLNERLKAGQDLAHAAIGASRDRLRAVLLTSLTTIGGLLPLLFETSRQAQFLLPMAVTIVFGLAMATVLVLFLVPALMGIGNDIRAAFISVFGHQHHRSEATGSS
ncbi:efflux RND transporter permease subunit [Hoeflea prorocentri]|uniref:Efflux RND transporter permease subunit n=1 Tax=Hoeflea prorocentri TaxID=1922333 RepID=A0A9X3ZIK6_9HYPH|nr:efflux RND transporter permease subunit [Hoeflea prorocentri]MCY6382544.1 efflux RND transporter permease subunit [Hoeflea prorocentri]MDA5400344.1 efflux RND transporter permease subunit [Hoeflea prorocentri]